MKFMYFVSNHTVFIQGSRYIVSVLFCCFLLICEFLGFGFYRIIGSPFVNECKKMNYYARNAAKMNRMFEIITSLFGSNMNQLKQDSNNSIIAMNALSQNSKRQTNITDISSENKSNDIDINIVKSMMDVKTSKK